MLASKLVYDADVEAKWKHLNNVWPLPNAKEVTAEEALHWFTTYGPGAWLHGESMKVDGDWCYIIILPVDHSRLIGGGYAALVPFNASYHKKLVRWFEWSACDHNFTTKTVGRCLTRYTCSKCQGAYEVDSSD